MQAPDAETRQTLRTLFPGGGSGRQAFSPPALAFDAHSALREPAAKKRKISHSLERRKRVTVVLLPAHVSTVPRGATRQQLTLGGRVLEVLFLRSWTELRVRQTICEVFLDKLDEDDPEGDISFLSSNAGAGISDAPDPSTFPGQSTDVGWTGQRVLHLAGRGNLYIKSRKEMQAVHGIVHAHFICVYIYTPLIV